MNEIPEKEPTCVLIVTRSSPPRYQMQFWLSGSYRSMLYICKTRALKDRVEKDEHQSLMSAGVF